MNTYGIIRIIQDIKYSNEVSETKFTKIGIHTKKNLNYTTSRKGFTQNL